MSAVSAVACYVLVVQALVFDVWVVGTNSVASGAFCIGRDQS